MSYLTKGRLPLAVRPQLYHLTLTVRPETRQFDGEVRIDLDVLETTSVVVLHALELAISQPRVRQGDAWIPVQIEADAASETIALSFPTPLTAGRAQVALAFSGRLNPQLRGLYEVKWGGETFAFTQFEATDARRMFPCFDEPAMKARFRMTVSIPTHLTALSNMPVASTLLAGDLKTVTFDETPVMSTYLLALGVARLEARTIQVGPTQVSVWTVPGQLHLSDFALKVTAAVLPMLNDYFDLPYPYPKLDLVSVPDFAMGAMENWGAIFFRDSRLLVDEARTATGTLRDVANVITHEIVHQWFGNLVTMIWWDDLWLNEAFATWLAAKIVDQWRPEWNGWIEFQQEKQIPLAVDALSATRPIRAEVTTAAQIEEMFDALTYEKGAACLRMIEQFLGDAKFRAGIRRYMKENAFQNATSDALWSALADASGQPVSDIAHDWFMQPGFPLVTLSLAGNSLRIEQSRFQALRASPSEQKWTIPVVLKYRDEAGISTYPVLLKDAVTEITLPASGAVDWVYGNANEAGFLRTRYESDLAARLSAIVPDALSPEERVGYLNHLWALTVRGDLPMGDMMAAFGRFQNDTTRAVVQDITNYLGILGNQMVTDASRPAFAAWVGRFYRPLWARLGWAAEGEDDERRLTRASVLWALGAHAQDEEILSELPRLQTRYWAKPESLDPTLVLGVLRLCARTDGGSQFETYIQKFQTGRTPEERDDYLTALAEFHKPDLALRLLSFALSDAVRTQDVWKPVRALLMNGRTQGVAWTFVRENWQDLRKKSGSVGAQRMIQATRALWSEPWRAEVAAFFGNPANRVEAAERALAQTLEFMDIGIRFKATQQATLSDYLK
jgi:puromycin-sensitive aminopeptidase